MKEEGKGNGNITFYIAVVLIFCVIFFVKDKNNKVIQAAAKQQTIQKTP
ncbi:MAG: hypothetical protein AAB681_03305 [Patescibacteria group bacterium]